ncbi:hypothetical protein FB451DRAFT_1374653 [Mycena latifolia]|nr:hypothetical protein FB451DRAFT_1374653 [Mycena latifolia]
MAATPSPEHLHIGSQIIDPGGSYRYSNFGAKMRKKDYRTHNPILKWSTSHTIGHRDQYRPFLSLFIGVVATLFAFLTSTCITEPVKLVVNLVALDSAVEPSTVVAALIIYFTELCALFFCIVHRRNPVLHRILNPPRRYHRTHISHLRLDRVTKYGLAFKVFDERTTLGSPPGRVLGSVAAKRIGYAFAHKLAEYGAMGHILAKPIHSPITRKITRGRPLTLALTLAFSDAPRRRAAQIVYNGDADEGLPPHAAQRLVARDRAQELHDNRDSSSPSAMQFRSAASCRTVHRDCPTPEWRRTNPYASSTMDSASHTGEGVLPHPGAAPVSGAGRGCGAAGTVQRLAFGVGSDRPHRIADDGADDSARAHVVMERVFAAGAYTVVRAPRSRAERRLDADPHRCRDNSGESHAREHRKKSAHKSQLCITAGSKEIRVPKGSSPGVGSSLNKYMPF